MPRVPAPELEAAVVTALRKADAAAAVESDTWSDRELIASLLDKVTVGKGQIEIALRSNGPDALIILPWQRPSHPRRRDVMTPEGEDDAAVRAIRMEHRAKLLHAIARARSWLEELLSVKSPA